MPPPLASRDTQATWQPTWLFTCAALPHTYAIRDLSIPAVGGDPFVTGDSETGGDDLVGGGSGPDALHAWGRLIGWPTVTRRLVDTYWPVVEVESVRLKVAERLSGDYRGQPFTLERYDAASGFRLQEWSGLIASTEVDHEGTQIEGVSVDLGLLEESVPDDVVDLPRFPYADASALGQTIPRVFGNVVDLALLYVNDDVIRSRFDYLIQHETSAALRALRRLTPSGADPTVTMTFDELEPYPGMDGVLVNGDLEDWDAGPAVAPTAWVVEGAGATVAKDIVNVDEGDAAAALTRVGTNCGLMQDLLANAPTLPLAWWQGREITLQARVRASVAATVFLRIDDSVSATQGGTHSGSGLYELLSATRTIDAAATSVDINLRINTTNQTVQLDDVRVYLRAKSWEECLRPDLYAGYTALRTFFRQDADGASSLYQLVADVNGRQPERNPIRALRTLLTEEAGRTVDAATWNQAEIEAALTTEGVVRLDGPLLFLPFRDRVPDATVASVTIRDRSGHERHGTAFNAGSGIPIGFGGPASDGTYNADDAALLLPTAGEVGTYASVPSSLAYSSQFITIECWVQIASGNLPDAGAFPLVEKLVGTASLSGYGLYRTGNALRFFVRGTDATLYTVDSALIDVVDEGRWIHVVGRAFGGTLVLLRDGETAAAGSYSSTIAEGDGEVLIGRFGAGAGNPGRDWMDNVALYGVALPVARVAAHAAAPPRDLAQPVVSYLQGMASIAPSPELWYMLADVAGSAVMTDSSGNAHQGTYVGTPLLGVPGPLNPERGYINGFGGARFVNNIAQYGVETGMTLAGTEGTVIAFYAPAAWKAKAGVCEKTIGGVRGTQWSLCQISAVVRFTLVTSGGTFTVDAPLVAEDVDRYGWYVATWGSGTIEVYKNGGLAAAGTYTGTPSSGVGDFYIGCQGTAGGPLTRPGNGDIAHVSYTATHWPLQNVTEMWTAATWYNGGLTVDVALRAPRQLQDWLTQIGQLVDARLGGTAGGAITCTTGLTPPATIRIDARDGAGDGDRNIVAISGRRKPGLEDVVRDLVVRYRPDLLTGVPLRTIRRAVSTQTDANGRRIGKKRVMTLEAVREDPSADRFCDRLAKQLAAGEDTVRITLHQEARQLMEGDLVQTTDALMDYASAVMQAREVNKALTTIEATLAGWDEFATSYTPSAFPAGASPG